MSGFDLVLVPGASALNDLPIEVQRAFVRTNNAFRAPAGWREGIDYEVIHEFTILQEGWELDNKGWVAQDKNTRDLFLLTTSHGGTIRMSVEDLREVYEEHQQALDGQATALTLMGAEV